MKRILFILLLLTVGCSTASQRLSTDKIYRANLRIGIDGQSYDGVAALPAKGRYDFTFQAKKDMDFFVFRTCHREWTTERQDDKKKFTYYPQWPIEQGPCPAEVDALSQKGKHGFGFIVFRELGYDLSAKQLKCNGIHYKQGELEGVSVCQAGAGLEQFIEFPVMVVLSDVGQAGCELEKTPKEGMAFRFKVPLGRCVYTFMEKDKPHRKHRMWTRGYDSIVLLEN